MFIIHKNYFEIYDCLRAFSQYTVACELDMITQYLQQILGYHVEFKVRLVSKPLVRVVLSNFLNYSDFASDRSLRLQIV